MAGDTRFHRRRDYTDTAVLVGPNLRWVLDDYEDLTEQRPEVLLGYNVLLSTPDTLFKDLRGRRIAKVVILEGPYASRQYDLVDREVHLFSYWDGGNAEIEKWHVHRVRGIWRVR